MSGFDFNKKKSNNEIKKCPSCGDWVPKEARYCPFCGNAFAAPEPGPGGSIDLKKYLPIAAGALAIIVILLLIGRPKNVTTDTSGGTDSTSSVSSDTGAQSSDTGAAATATPTPIPTATATPTPTVTPIPTATLTPTPVPSTTIEPVHVVDPTTNSYISIPDDTSTSYFRADSNSRYYSESDISRLTQGQVRYLINEIYARNGYIFENPDWYNYFMQKTWYRPTIRKADFTDANLNMYEVANVKMITKYQTDHHFVNYG